MKTTLLPTAWLAALIFVTCSALAGTTNIYVEDWGTGNPNVIYNNGGLSSVGWTPVAVSQTTGPYVGIYTASPQPTDSATGESLPANTTYFSVLLPT